MVMMRQIQWMKILMTMLMIKLWNEIMMIFVNYITIHIKKSELNSFIME